MVYICGHSCDDPSRVVNDGVCIDVACNGSAVVDLFHHCSLSLDGTMLGDRGVRVVAEARALDTKRSASSSHIFRFASEICVLAKTMLATLETSEVGLRGGVGHTASTAVTDVLEPLIHWFGSPYA